MSGKIPIVIHSIVASGVLMISPGFWLIVLLILLPIIINLTAGFRINSTVSNTVIRHRQITMRKRRRVAINSNLVIFFASWFPCILIASPEQFRLFDIIHLMSCLRISLDSANTRPFLHAHKRVLIPGDFFYQSWLYNTPS